MRNNNKILVILCLVMLTSFGCKKQTDSSTVANANVVQGIEKADVEVNSLPDSEDKSDVNEEGMHAEREKTSAAESGDEMPSSKTADVVPEMAESVSDNKVEKTEIAPETETVVCKNWGSNALFVDGSVFYYKVAFEQHNSGYECDEDMGNGDIYLCEGAYYVYCHVKLLYATDDYCGSRVSCELAPKYNQKEYRDDMDGGLPIEGGWFVDKNGYYKFNWDFTKASEAGKCKHLKYIKCEPGTLAYEYEIFNNMEPLIPLTPGIKVYEVQEASEDDPFDGKTTVSKTGTTWCYHSVSYGSDDFVNDICVDEFKGPSSFNYEFSGASDIKRKGSMRPIPKKK